MQATDIVLLKRKICTKKRHIRNVLDSDKAEPAVPANPQRTAGTYPPPTKWRTCQENDACQARHYRALRAAETTFHHQTWLRVSKGCPFCIACLRQAVFLSPFLFGGKKKGAACHTEGAQSEGMQSRRLRRKSVNKRKIETKQQTNDYPSEKIKEK